MLVNCANCSARNTAYSRSGASRRVATTTRHIGHVPCDALARLGRERHAAVAERAVAAGLPLGRVAALLVHGAVLGQADHHVAPVELVAVAPPQRGDGGEADQAHGQPGSEKWVTREHDH